MSRKTDTESFTEKRNRVALEIIKIVVQSAVVGTLSALIQHFIFKM